MIDYYLPSPGNRVDSTWAFHLTDNSNDVGILFTNEPSLIPTTDYLSRIKLNLGSPINRGKDPRTNLQAILIETQTTGFVLLRMDKFQGFVFDNTLTFQRKFELYKNFVEVVESRTSPNFFSSKAKPYVDISGQNMSYKTTDIGYYKAILSKNTMNPPPGPTQETITKEQAASILSRLDKQNQLLEKLLGRFGGGQYFGNDQPLPPQPHIYPPQPHIHPDLANLYQSPIKTLQDLALSMAGNLEGVTNPRTTVSPPQKEEVKPQPVVEKKFYFFAVENGDLKIAILTYENNLFKRWDVEHFTIFKNAFIMALGKGEPKPLPKDAVFLGTFVDMRDRSVGVQRTFELLEAYGQVPSPNIVGFGDKKITPEEKSLLSLLTEMIDLTNLQKKNPRVFTEHVIGAPITVVEALIP